MSRVYSVIVTPEALDNLDAIVNYIKRNSPQKAAATIERLWNATQALSQLPHRCKVHRSSNRPERVVHSMSVPPYLIYYRILETPPIVRVLTIRHGTRRQPQRFK